MVRIAILIASLSLASLGASFAAAGVEPSALVTEVYGASDASGHYRKPLAIFVEAPLRARYLTSHLQTRLAEMEKRNAQGDAPALDFDVVSDSQNPDVQDLKISTESETDAEAVVVADFRSDGESERSVLRFELMREDGAWKIDDVEATGKRHWRVREMIAGE